MIYFCADDYGVSKESNSRIETCLKQGALNKISVLPNGEIDGFRERLSGYDVKLCLHLNLVEGAPLSNPKDVELLVNEQGYFAHSFLGLLFLSCSKKRKQLKQQLYLEIKHQLQFWKQQMGETADFLIDSHQHTHMIPLVFQTLMRVIEEEALQVSYLRIPKEPLSPYLLSPSLYLKYPLSGIAKQWLLNLLAFWNKKEQKASKIPTAYFMGALFSGRISEANLKIILPKYKKLAKKHKKNIEIGFHPGYMKPGEVLMKGTKTSFQKFYFSPRRKTEYDTLLNVKPERNNTKEG